MTPSSGLSPASDLGRSKSTTAATRACFAVCAAGLAGAAAMVLLGHAGLWKDEVWYLSSVPELHRLGLSRAFLRELPGPAGPLYAVVHAAFEPLTGLAQPGVRLVTMGLALLTFLALGTAMRLRGVRSPYLKAPTLIAAPMMFGAVGTAITEIPAALFFCLNLALLFAALDRADRGSRGAVAVAALAGLSCGVAISGRQQYLIAPLASVLLFRPSTRWVVPAYILAALALPIPIFLAWGGIVPPRTEYVGSGISIAHGLLSFSYAGLVYCLYDVRWIFRRPLLNLALIALTVGLNFAFKILNHLPLQELARRYLPPAAQEAYGLIACGAMLGFGVVFVLMLARMAWEGRHDRATLFVCAMVLLMLSAPAKITHMFAGRYITTALPLMVLLAAERVPDTYAKAARLALGCVAGLLSLAAFLSLL